MDMSLSRLWELVMARKSGVLQSMGLQRVGHDWLTEQEEEEEDTPEFSLPCEDVAKRQQSANEEESPH